MVEFGTALLTDGIHKICSLGDDFEQVHKLYATYSTWSSACQILDACPSQSALSTRWYAQQHSRSSTGRHNQAHLDEAIEEIKAFLLQHGVCAFKKVNHLLPS